MSASTGTGTDTVRGHCDPAFAAVREVFERSFADGRDLGAGVTVYVEGRQVVELWGGVADRRSGRAWERDTPCVTFSCTKAVTAAAALLLAERGAYDIEGPVTDWWPEYGVAGKAGTTAAHLLSHQAGLPAFGRPVNPEEASDPAAMAAVLAAQAPEWTPGEDHGYHAVTYGWLAGEIVRRHSGRPVGRFVREEFGGELDLWIGAPGDVIERAARLAAARHARPATETKGTDDPGTAADTDAKGTTSRAGGRVGDRPGDRAGVTAAPAGAGTAATHDGPAGRDLLTRLAAASRDPESTLNRALNSPLPGKRGYNDPVVLRGGWPASGMVTTAAGLAGFYRDLVAGRIIGMDTLREAIKPRVSGPDRTLIVDTAFGLGFMRPAMTFAAMGGPAEAAFGHNGMSGALGLGDADAGLGMAYVPNLMGGGMVGDRRSADLVRAVYDALA